MPSLQSRRTIDMTCTFAAVAISLCHIIAATVVHKEVGHMKLKRLFGNQRVRAIFGTPEVIWKRGESLRDYGINAVFIGHGGLKGELLKRCRREGARVFFEIGIFVGKATAEKHPELHPIGADGKPLKPDGWYLGLCPTVEWYRNERLHIIRETLEKYDVDGVWLDFIRYPCHWEVKRPRIEQACFNDSCLTKFQRDTGIKPQGETRAQKAQWILKHHLDDWTKWKCQQIASFCQQVRDIIYRVRPNALLGIFSVPWREQDYEDAIHKIIAQDFELLAKYVDVFSPMVYHIMCGFPADWVGDYTDYLRRKTKRPVVPIVQAVDKPEPITPQVFERVLRLPLERGSEGVMMFTIKAVMENEAKIMAMKRVYGAFR